MVSISLKNVQLDFPITYSDNRSLRNNLAQSFKNKNDNFNFKTSLKEINLEIKELANQIGVSTFNSKSKGLNNEVTEFIEISNSYSSWAICHADLPYLNKYNISVYLQEISINQIVISKSSDNGTPLIGGCALFKNFRYGESSFKKHVLEFEKLNLSYKQVFNKELYFELDTENDYLEFLKNKPRWYKKY